MQAVAGKVKCLRARGLIETAQDVFNVFQKIRPYPASVVAFEKPFQAPMFEASNHHDAVKQYLPIVKLYFTTPGLVPASSLECRETPASASCDNDSHPENSGRRHPCAARSYSSSSTRWPAAPTARPPRPSPSTKS